MLKAQVDSEKCKGCRLCVAACPKSAIRALETLNRRGAPIVAVDRALCIGCGACYATCPDYVFVIVEEARDE